MRQHTHFRAVQVSRSTDSDARGKGEEGKSAGLRPGMVEGRTRG